jgi:hypothetical protein
MSRVYRASVDTLEVPTPYSRFLSAFMMGYTEEDRY